MGKELELGIPVWCYCNNHNWKLSKGKLIHQFQHGNQFLYVIEFETGIEPVYETRDWWTISLDGNRIHFWENIRNKENTV